MGDRVALANTWHVIGGQDLGHGDVGVVHADQATLEWLRWLMENPDGAHR